MLYSIYHFSTFYHNSPDHSGPATIVFKTNSPCLSVASSRACFTALTTFPVPASPLVLIIAAPSATLLTAYPKLVQPQTKGIVNLSFAMW